LNKNSWYDIRNYIMLLRILKLDKDIFCCHFLCYSLLQMSQFPYILTLQAFR
jgi:hypothetical protein